VNLVKKEEAKAGVARGLLTGITHQSHARSYTVTWQKGLLVPIRPNCCHYPTQTRYIMDECGVAGVWLFDSTVVG
jgi:hypothetical protein